MIFYLEEEISEFYEKVTLTKYEYRSLRIFDSTRLLR